MLQQKINCYQRWKALAFRGKIRVLLHPISQAFWGFSSTKAFPGLSVVRTNHVNPTASVWHKSALQDVFNFLPLWPPSTRPTRECNQAGLRVSSPPVNPRMPCAWLLLSGLPSWRAKHQLYNANVKSSVKRSQRKQQNGCNKNVTDMLSIVKSWSN